MSSYGFVYVLRNEYMPHVCKIGCTEKSPHARAEELSRATGVPTSFFVACYIEVHSFQEVERDMHRWLAAYRINSGREFFSIRGDAGLYIASLFQYHPERLAFVDSSIGDLTGARDPWETWDPWGPDSRSSEPTQTEPPPKLVPAKAGDFE